MMSRHKCGEDDKPYIKKPLNAFMLYRAEQRELVMMEFNIKNSAEVNKIVGERWKLLRPEEQAPYFDQARAAKREHEAKYPGWSAADNFGRKKRRKGNTTTPTDAVHPPAPVQPVFYNYHPGMMAPANYYHVVQQIPANINPAAYANVVSSAVPGQPTFYTGTAYENVISSAAPQQPTFYTGTAYKNVINSAAPQQPTFYTGTAYENVINSAAPQQPTFYTGTAYENVISPAAPVQATFDNEAQMALPTIQPTRGATKTTTKRPAPTSNNSAQSTSDPAASTNVSEVFRMPKFRIVYKNNDYVPPKKAKRWNPK